MESLPKVITSVPESKEEEYEDDENSITYANCNMCRNFSNVHKSDHRRSKEHQARVTEKFRLLRSRIRLLGRKSVSVHDEDWLPGEVWFCYFCDKPIKRNKISEGLMIDSFGYMTHVASPEHAKAVKVYLRYHGREENFDLFCFSKEEFDRFVGKIPEARKKYVANLSTHNAKDIQSIRDIEDQRKKLVAETIHNSVINTETILIDSLQPSSAIISPFMKEHISKRKGKFKRENKMKSMTCTPWQTEENGNKDRKKENCTAPVKSPTGAVIGPTIETFNKHVATLNNKKFPSLRLSKLTGEYSSGWMPHYRGVWNKGKRKKSKQHCNCKY